MFETIGAPELLIIGLVFLLLFGVGKVGRLGKDLGEGIKEFRRAMKDEDGTPAPPSAYLAAPGAPPPAYTLPAAVPAPAPVGYGPSLYAPAAQPSLAPPQTGPTNIF